MCACSFWSKHMGVSTAYRGGGGRWQCSKRSPVAMLTFEIFIKRNAEKANKRRRDITHWQSPWLTRKVSRSIPSLSKQCSGGSDVKAWSLMRTLRSNASKSRWPTWTDTFSWFSSTSFAPNNIREFFSYWCNNHKKKKVVSLADALCKRTFSGEC